MFIFLAFFLIYAAYAAYAAINPYIPILLRFSGFSPSAMGNPVVSGTF
jgi:hypothetical protein